MRRLARRVHVDDADAGALRAWIDAEDAGHCGAVVVGRRPAGAASAAPTRPVAFNRTRPRPARHCCRRSARRSEEHTSELQSLMRISYAVFCLKKKNTKKK